MQLELTMKEFKMFSKETQKNFLEHITSLPSNCRSFIRFNVMEIWDTIFGSSKKIRGLVLLDNRSDLARYMVENPAVKIIDNPSMSEIQAVHCETIQMIQKLGPKYTGLQKELISLMYVEAYDFSSYSKYERMCSILLEKLCLGGSLEVPPEILLSTIKIITSNITPLKILAVIFAQAVNRTMLGMNEEYANLINRDDDRLLITYKNLMNIIYSDKPELSEIDLGRITDLLYIYGEMIGTVPMQFLYPIQAVYGDETKGYIQEMYMDKVEKSGSVFDLIGEIDWLLGEAMDPYDISGRQSDIFMRRVSLIDEDKYEKVNIEGISKIVETMNMELIEAYECAQPISFDFNSQEIMQLRNKYGLYLIIAMVHPIGESPLHKRLLLQVDDEIYALYKCPSRNITGYDILGLSYNRINGTNRRRIQVILPRDLFDFKY